MSCTLLKSVQALAHLAYQPCVEPLLVFWYARQQGIHRGSDPTRGGATVTFNEVLSQTIAMLQQHGRVSYRALKRQFAIPDDYLEDLKDAILFAYPQVRDAEGRGL